jgi:hypothetical protein
MLAFIHTNFKLDLTYLQVTFVEQNQIFHDDFSLEISFPFDIILDADFVRESGFSAHYNAHQNTSKFTGLLDRDGVITDANLKITKVKGKVASAVINSGENAFPSFNKKLSELPLEIKPVHNIIQDALEVIQLGYPDTNYNFPMIHTDKYDPTNEDWNGFGKIINNYKIGTFVVNELQEDSNIDLIKNIMQPLPSLMHILHTAMSSDGFTLAGDILEDPDLKNAYLFRDGDYYNRLSEEAIPLFYKNREWDGIAPSQNGIPHVTFYKEITILKKGDYALFGEIFSLIYRDFSIVATLNLSKLLISIGKVSGGVSSNLFFFENTTYQAQQMASKIVTLRTTSIDLTISFEVGDTLILSKMEARRDSVPSETPDYPDAISLNLIPIRYRNPDNSPILSVLNLNKIDLKKVVPDVTVRDLIIAIKNFKNYNFIPEGNVVFMNKIKKALIRVDAVDLSTTEIEEPVMSYHDDREFELLFADGKSDQYKYDSLLLRKNENILNDYVTKDSTSSIKIDLLPLPVILRNGVTTAHNFEDETAKIRLIFMKPMPEEGIPVAFLNQNALIPALYEDEYEEWIRYRLNSIAWSWDFFISVEKLRPIKVQSLLYAYSNYHLFTDIEKERINTMWWRVTAKSESLL